MTFHITLFYFTFHYFDLIATTGIACDQERRGLLYVHRTQESLERGVHRFVLRGVDALHLPPERGVAIQAGESGDLRPGDGDRDGPS